MQNRKENNRNIKRAGCVSSVGRPVMIVANKRCCCKKEVWCPLGNNKFKLSKPADCVPTLSSVNIVSDNVTTTLAVVGDTVTVTFTASVTIATPIVTFSCQGTDIIYSRVTTTNTSGNTWTASYDTVNGDGDGAVTYSIAFSDSTGNAGVAVTSGTGSVTFDKTSDKATMTYAFSDSAATFMQGITVTMTATFPSSLSVTPHLALTGADALPAGAMTAVSTTVYTRTYTIGNFDGAQTVALSVGKDLAGNAIVTAPTNPTFTLVGLEPTKADVDAVLTANFVAVAGQSVTLSAAPAAGNTAYLAPTGTTTSYGAPTASATITAAASAATQNILAPLSTTTGVYKAYLVDADSNLSVESTATVETVQDVNGVACLCGGIYNSNTTTPLGLQKRVPQGHKLFLAAASQSAGTQLTNSASTTSTSAGLDSILVPTQPSSGSHYKFYLTDIAGNIVERNGVTESTNTIQVV